MPSIKKAKTAFLFYQSEHLATIKRQVGGNMGEAMTECKKKKKCVVLYLVLGLFPANMNHFLYNHVTHFTSLPPLTS